MKQLLITFAFLVNVCAYSVEFGPDVVAITDSEYEKEVLQANVPVVVDFYADWCPPCRSMKPIISALSSQNSGQIKFVAMNIDRSPELRQKYGLKGIPSFQFVQNGKVVEKQFGSLPQEEFETVLRAAFNQKR